MPALGARSVVAAAALVLIGGAFAVRGWIGRAPRATVGVSGSEDTAEDTALASESRAASANAVQPSSDAPYGGTAPSAPSAAPPTPSGEAARMARLRLTEDRDPAWCCASRGRATRSIRTAPIRAERAMVVVKSFARQGALAEARSEAERMVNMYPGTRWARDLERLAGTFFR